MARRVVIMSRALLELQREFEEAEGGGDSAPAAECSQDDSVVQAELRAKLDALAIAKEHVCNLSRLSQQAEEARAAELLAVGLRGVLPAGSLPPSSATPPGAVAASPDAHRLIDAHGLIDAGALVRRAVESARPARWPEWGLPEAAHHAWEARLAAGLAGGGAAWCRGFVFTPGMLFGSGALWWPPFSPRDQPHPGLAYARFVDPSGEAHAVAAGTKVPCVLGGVVAAC